MRSVKSVSERKEVKPPPILTCTQTNPFLLTLPVCGEKETEHERLLRKTLNQQGEGSLFSCTEQYPSQQQANVSETEEEMAVLLESKLEEMKFIFVKVHESNQIFLKGSDTGGLLNLVLQPVVKPRQ